MRSPIRRITSPRAGAGVRRQSSNPRFADCTASSRSSAFDSGKRPIRSPESAGFAFSKYSPEEGSVHLPFMKFLNVFILLLRAGGREVRFRYLVHPHVVGCAGSPFA